MDCSLLCRYMSQVNILLSLDSAVTMLGFILQREYSWRGPSPPHIKAEMSRQSQNYPVLPLHYNLSFLFNFFIYFFHLVFCQGDINTYTSNTSIPKTCCPLYLPHSFLILTFLNQTLALSSDVFSSIISKYKLVWIFSFKYYPYCLLTSCCT